MNRLMILLIRFYQKGISPLFPGRCRYYPSCSEYAIQCFDYYGFFHAFFKSIYRILRCNPLASGYFDPAIPEEKNISK